MHKSTSVCPKCSGTAVRTISAVAYDLKTGLPQNSVSRVSADEVMCDNCYTIFNAPEYIHEEANTIASNVYVTVSVEEMLRTLKLFLSCNPPRNNYNITARHARNIEDTLVRLQRALPDFMSDGIARIVRINVETFPYFDGIIPEFDDFVQHVCADPSGIKHNLVTYYDQKADTYE